MNLSVKLQKDTNHYLEDVQIMVLMILYKCIFSTMGWDLKQK